MRVGMDVEVSTSVCECAYQWVRDKLKDGGGMKSKRKRQNFNERKKEGRKEKERAMETQNGATASTQLCKDGEMWATRTSACLMTIADVCNITTLHMAKEQTHWRWQRNNNQQSAINNQKKGGYKKAETSSIAAEKEVGERKRGRTDVLVIDNDGHGNPSPSLLINLLTHPGEDSKRTRKKHTSTLELVPTRSFHSQRHLTTRAKK